ncbi:MAG: hypothetical protein Q8K63_05340, partial [Acidimicrobiales bacterium]|nr:hypothetical protein [Acidimicrobiales bacterium]
MSAAADTSMMVANVRYELADGVTTDEKSAKAYDFADATEAAVAKLAKAFGVEGDIRQDGESWSVGGNDKAEEVRADGAYLYVSRNGGVFSMSVNQTASGSGSTGCSVVPAAPDTPVASDEDLVRCDAPVTTTTIPANAPTADDAKKVAADAMEAAGVDVDDAKVSVESFDGATQNVRFQHAVDGALVDGYESYVAVGPDDQIISASGYLIDPASVGTYDLATLERAVERLNETFSNVTTMEARDMAVAPAPGEPQTDPAISPEPSPSTEPTVVTLTKVKVGLMLQSDYDGDLWLVPAYQFTTSDGNPVTAQAAADKYIEQPPVSTDPPTDPPTDPGASDPGAGGSSPGSPGSCEAVEGDLSAQVCASSTTVKVGEPVQFRITATDADRGFATGCFDGVTAAYGDDAGG